VRGFVAGLASPHPVGARLPAIYQDDKLSRRICAALDEVIAPIFLTLDGLAAMLDPATTPEDMVDWLAGWIGITLTPGQSVQRQRELLAAGAELLRWRGTARGVRDAVQALLDVTPVVTETGGTEWSSTPGTELPGEPGGRLSVTVTVTDPEEFDEAELDALIAAIKPAHVLHDVRIRAAAGTGRHGAPADDLAPDDPVADDPAGEDR